MNKITPRTLKGFRDFLPKEARKRQFVIDKLRSVFESYGFEPLETPALEYAEILEGKYGEEGEKLMYKFEDKGGRKVALRYDQTVPLARVIAQYSNSIPLPFKRYQISNVWRGENPQRGRFREFLQCDIDIAGISSSRSDAEIIQVAMESLERLGFKNFKILVNDRSLFEKIPKDALLSIDKLGKIGEKKVMAELSQKGIDVKILDKIKLNKPGEKLQKIISLIKDKRVIFEPTLARGLDYYTGLIIEVEVEGFDAGSVGGGGRYDNLIGLFSNQTIPAVGFSFGFDRLIEAIDELNLFPAEVTTTKVLVTLFSKELEKESIQTASMLREKGINTEVYLDEAKMDKQLKYANQKGIPYVVIIGPDEAKSASATLKNMKTGEQNTLPLDQLSTSIT